MNRTLDQTAAVLVLKPRAFRTRLRELRILTNDGHYAVVMVKEGGLEWIAKTMNITITHKDAAA